MILAGKKNKDFLLPILLSILVLVVLLLLILSWFVFDIQRNKGNNWARNATENKLETKKEFLDLSNIDPEVGGVVEKVSQHILLPSKQFTVATVKDAVSLYKENPVLYQYIRNGQKVLLYDTGAIVYDETLNKIVDIIQFYAARQEKLLKE